MYYPRLKDLREDQDLTQKELAEILGIDQRVYSNYETGKREIPTRLVVYWRSTIIRPAVLQFYGITNRPIPYEQK